ncbi:MAG: hypothetical protein WBR29_10805 [Gammaproteobacteria bacterium]
MNPTILTFPALSANPSKLDWKLNRFDARNVSPLSGTFQDVVRPGAYWSCEMSWNVLSYADSQLLMAWSAQMSRGGFRTALPNYAYVIQGSGAGTPVVDGASQTGTSLTTDGWTPSSSNVLKAGDMFNVYAGSITFVTAPANTYLVTFTDYYGNSYSIGTGNGSTLTWNLPATFFTGYNVYVNAVLQTYTSQYTTTMQHQLLMVTANASSNGSGVATLNFEPALRFSPTNGSAIILSTPSAAFAFTKAGANISYTAPRIAALSLSLLEDIQL